MEAYCFAAYAEALEVIPTTLAENAGLNPIAMVTELRNRHALGERSAGINVRKVSRYALGLRTLLMQNGDRVSSATSWRRTCCSLYSSQQARSSWRPRRWDSCSESTSASSPSLALLERTDDS